MMDFKEFQDKILQEAKDRMWGVEVGIQPVEKLQGESYTGLSIKPNDSPVAATLNLDQVYSQMFDGKSFDEVADDLISHAADIITDMPKIDVNDLINYDQ
ncbi:MAG: DUF5688 family protein, partial [Eubacteriales bacterium]|nr:DUF5688 family protein [Eubacteriales bacterium]